MSNITKIENGLRVIDEINLESVLRYISDEIDNKYSNIRYGVLVDLAFNRILDIFLYELHFEGKKLDHCEIETDCHGDGFFNVVIKNHKMDFHRTVKFTFNHTLDLQEDVLEVCKDGLKILIDNIRNVYVGRGV